MLSVDSPATIPQFITEFSADRPESPESEEEPLPLPGFQAKRVMQGSAGKSENVTPTTPLFRRPDCGGGGSGRRFSRPVDFSSDEDEKEDEVAGGKRNEDKEMPSQTDPSKQATATNPLSPPQSSLSGGVVEGASAFRKRVPSASFQRRGKHPGSSSTEKVGYLVRFFLSFSFCPQRLGLLLCITSSSFDVSAAPLSSCSLSIALQPKEVMTPQQRLRLAMQAQLKKQRAYPLSVPLLACSSP